MGEDLSDITAGNGSKKREGCRKEEKKEKKVKGSKKITQKSQEKSISGKTAREVFTRLDQENSPR